jgi:sugar phosphate permease
MFAWSRSFYGYWNLAFVTIVYAFTQGMFFTVGINVPIMAKALGWNAAQYGLASTVYLVSLGLMCLVAGYLVPRVGARRLMLWFSALPALSVFGMSFVQETWQLYLCTAGIGVGAGLAAIIAAPTIVGNWLHRRRGFGLALVISSSALMAIIWSQISLLLLSSSGSYQTVLRVEGLMGLIAPVVAILFVRERPADLGQTIDGVPDAERAELARRQPRGRAYKTTEPWTAGRALRHPVFWLITLSTCFEAFVYNGLNAHQVSVFEASGLSVATAVTAFGLVNTFGGIGRLLGGFLADYVEPRYLLAFFQTLLSVGLLFFALQHSWSGSIYVYVVAVGLANGEIFLMATVLFTNYFGPEAFPALAGLANPLQSLVFSGIGPVTVGALLDGFGSFVPVLIGLAVVNVVAAVLALLGRPPRRRPREGRVDVEPATAQGTA